MELIAHRGLWSKTNSKNSLKSLKIALFNNIHIETDIRDYNGEIYISHDPINANSNQILLRDLISAHKQLKSKSKIFLNVKSDGLLTLMRDEIFLKNKLFFFDMSTPELVIYLKNKMDILIRKSDVEDYKIHNNLYSGYWIDSFYDNQWFFKKNRTILKNKFYSFVSPELHQKDHLDFWKQLSKLNHHKNIYLCTDLVYQASIFFNKKLLSYNE
jgi:hypothetical protein